MKRDFHMHPSVMQAPERFDAFIQEAIRKKIGEICITDHMSLSCSDAPDRIPKGRVREYCARVRELAEKYEDRIVIRCGIEVDFHPSVLPEIEDTLGTGDFDFILASSHIHIFLKEFEKYSFNRFAGLALENSIRAVEYGAFSTLAHLDMYRWAFERRERFPMTDDGYSLECHKDLIQELLRAISEREMFLEINPHLAAAKHDLTYTYPQDTVVSWALAQEIRFSYGSDEDRSVRSSLYLAL